MNQFKLEFEYKGNRTYVHGTDIYRQIIKNIKSLGYGNWQYFELNIKKISTHNMICFLTEKKQRLNDEIINFNLIKDQKPLYGSIIEDITDNIKSGYFFDENEITRDCFIDIERQTIVYTNSLNKYSTIDIIISMSKFYLENAVDNSAKWFFRTIKFLRPIDDIKFRQIILCQKLQKRNIVELEVYIENQMVGYAYGASVTDL